MQVTQQTWPVSSDCLDAIVRNTYPPVTTLYVIRLTVESRQQPSSSGSSPKHLSAGRWTLGVRRFNSCSPSSEHVSSQHSYTAAVPLHYTALAGQPTDRQEPCTQYRRQRLPQFLVRERSALATLIFTSRVCLSVIRSVILSFCLSVRKFGAKYLGNEAR